MKHAEFEEREFETSLYHQLAVASNLVWSPGQVLENHVGFDFSALCVDSYFWAIHGLRQPLDGFFLEELYHRRIWRRRNSGRQLPDFGLNLFLQAKRPEVKARLSKALKGQALSLPHWRIGIDKDQQQTLDALSKATGGRGLVCYAAPAFDRLTQLYAHTRQGTIVANSSFPQADWLTGHEAWNYDGPGASGVANAHPRQIDGPSLEARIEGLVAEYSNSQTSGFDANLKELAQSVLSSVQGPEATSARAALFFRRTAEIDLAMGALDLRRYREPIENFLRVLAFSATYQLQWYVLGRR